MKSKGEVISGLISVSLALCKEAAESAMGREIKFCRGRKIIEIDCDGNEINCPEGFISYLQSTRDENETIIEAFIRWAELDAEHEYERAARESAERALAHKSCSFRIKK